MSSASILHYVAQIFKTTCWFIKNEMQTLRWIFFFFFCFFFSLNFKDNACAQYLFLFESYIITRKNITNNVLDYEENCFVKK
jgi:hypothetical protein